MAQQRVKGLPFRLLAPDGQLVVTKLRALERHVNRRAVSALEGDAAAEVTRWAVEALERGLKSITKRAYAAETESEVQA